MDWSLAYFELGLFTGFSAGLLGIGGGLVMVPTLAIIFAAQPGFPPEQTLHMALGTLMATILLTSLANLRTHPQYGAVLWKVVRQPPPGNPTRHRARYAARFKGPDAPPGALLDRIRLLCRTADDPQPQAQSVAPATRCGRPLFRRSGHRLDIGGGAFTVPLLSWCNVHFQKAIGFPIALGGSLSYIDNGWGHAELPA